jgi:membrane protease YdiL (CAAX protease family)
MDAIPLPINRPFVWRAFWILGLLFVAGNVASIPVVLEERGSLAESLPQMLGYLILTFLMIWIAMQLGRRTGLGAPFLEGVLRKGESRQWLRRVVALSCVVAIVFGLLISVPALLVRNGAVHPDEFIAPWKYVLASLDAGIQEELFYRFFLMTLLVWLGSLVWKDADGRPAGMVIWAAIAVSGLVFGWAHIDEMIGPLAHAGSQAVAMRLMWTSLFGCVAGWLYWRFGLETAMLWHFLTDALATALLMPVFLACNAGCIIGVVIGLGVALVISWRLMAAKN